MSIFNKEIKDISWKVVKWLIWMWLILFIYILKQRRGILSKHSTTFIVLTLLILIVIFNPIHIKQGFIITIKCIEIFFIILMWKLIIMCHDFIPWIEIIRLDRFKVLCFELNLNRSSIVTNIWMCDRSFIEN